VAKSIMIAPVGAAVACATFHIENKTMERFVKVLTDQLDAGPGEMAAKVLRHFIQDLKGNRRDRHEVFLKACRAIELFAERNEMKAGRLYAAPENPFPIPRGQMPGVEMLIDAEVAEQVQSGDERGQTSDPQ
jgi:hypothetical protein